MARRRNGRMISTSTIYRYHGHAHKSQKPDSTRTHKPHRSIPTNDTTHHAETSPSWYADTVTTDATLPCTAPITSLLVLGVAHSCSSLNFSSRARSAWQQSASPVPCSSKTAPHARCCTFAVPSPDRCKQSPASAHHVGARDGHRAAWTPHRITRLNTPTHTTFTLRRRAASGISTVPLLAVHKDTR